MEVQPRSAWVEERLKEQLRHHVEVGANLWQVRSIQEETGVCESYDLGHLEDAVRFEYRQQPKVRAGKHEDLCKDHHGPDCTVCTTCHFCRQKTVDQKTYCPRCNTGNGIWCAGCLAGRVGQNINEVLGWCAEGAWACPVCLDICNCSGINCLRLSRGWEKTGQLYHEAKRLNYKSVAHYLILTALDREAPRHRQRPQNGPAYRSRPGNGNNRQQQQQLPASHGSRRQLRRQKAEQVVERVLQACRDVFSHLDLGLGLQGAGDGVISSDLLDPADDDDIIGGAAALLGLGQGGSRGLLSPGSNAGQAPAPLFRGAGGSGAAAEPNSTRQQQPRRGSVIPGHAAAAAAAAGTAPGRAAARMPPPPPRAAGGPGSVVAAGRTSPDIISPSAAAAPADMLDMLGFDLQPEELAVLSSRSCSSGVFTQQPPQPPQQPGVAARPSESTRPSRGGATAVGHEKPVQQGSNQTGSFDSCRGHAAAAAATAAAAAAVGPAFGPEDLPGADAPGYGVSDNRVLCAARRQQRLQQPGGVGFPQRRPGNGSWYQPSQHTASRAARGHSSIGRHCTGGRHDAGSAVPSMPAAALESELMQETQEQPAAKRARLQEAGTSASGAAAGAGGGGGGGGSAGAGGAGAAAVGDTDDGVILQDPCDATQQQQQQQSVAGVNADGVPSGSCQPAAGGGNPSGTQPQQDNYTFDPEFEFPVFTPVGHQQAEQQQQQQDRLSEAVELQKQMTGLIADGIGPGGGLSYYEMCHVLGVIMDKAFEANRDFDRPLVVHSSWHEDASSIASSSSNSGSSSNSLKITQACDVLEFLAKYVPPESYDDIVRRFRSEPILEFSASDPAARAKLLMTASTILLQVLGHRVLPHAAVFEALVAADQSRLSAAGAAAAVRQLAEAALGSMAQAQEAMQDLTACLVDWMSALQQEVAEVQAELKKAEANPGHLLGALKLGPIQWSSAHAQCQHAWAAGPVQLQEAEQGLLDERMLSLTGLQRADGELLSLLAKSIAQQAYLLPRRLASQLLSAPVLHQLLDVGMPYQAEAQYAFLQLVMSLVKQAAPDLEHDQHWAMHDAHAMLQGLPVALQQLQQRSSMRAAMDSRQLEECSSKLVVSLTEQPVEKACRQQQVAILATGAVPHLLLAVDGLLTEGGIPPQKQHATNLGTGIRQALTALYALQLQAGSTTWVELEAGMMKAAEHLPKLFSLLPASHQRRRLVLLLAFETAQMAPSLVSWVAASSPRLPPQHRSPASHGFGTGGVGAAAGGGMYPAWQREPSTHAPAPAQPAGPAAAAAPSHIPATALLQLWLRLLVDLHTGTTFAKCVQHISIIMVRTPAMATLFDAGGSVPWPLHAALQQSLLLDADGALRAVLARRVLQAVRDRQGEAALCEVVRGLCKDVVTKQQELEQYLRLTADPSLRLQQLVKLLSWQRSCLRTLLVVADTVLQCPEIDKAQPLRELVTLMTSFMQDGIRAVCRLQPESFSPNGNIGSMVQGLLQDSALNHLAAYLGRVVGMAGYAGGLECSSTLRWPAYASSSNSINQTLHQLVRGSAAAASNPRSSQVQQLCSSIKSVLCIRDLVGTALQHLSGQDELRAQDAALLTHMASAFEQQAGLCPEAVQQGAGHSSPGLLHHLLHTHVHAALKAAAQPDSTELHIHRAVNALHLVRQLLQRPGLQQQHTQRLLLPCLAFPLFEVLKAPVGRCTRLLRHVYQLLQQLLTGPGSKQLLPEQALEPLGGSTWVGFKDGALSLMAPISQPDLQEVLYRLMVRSLQACTALVAAAHQAASAQQQQQQQDTVLFYKLLSILGTPRSECTATVALLGPACPADLARLGLTPAAGSMSHSNSRALVVAAAVCFASELVANHDAAAAAASSTLVPVLGPLANEDPITWQRINADYRVLLARLRAARQKLGHFPGDAFRSPSPGTTGQQQQQQQQQPHPQQQPQPIQPQQQQGQQQQPRQHQQQQRPVAAAAPASACTSQACSRAGPGHWQARQHSAPADAADVPAAGRQQVQVPAASQCFSEGGGWVASCHVGGGPTQQAGTAAAAAALPRKRPNHCLSAGDQQDDGDEDDDVSSSRGNKRRAGTAAAQRQLPSEEMRPDVHSQDQGVSPGTGRPAAGLQEAGWQQQQQRHQPQAPGHQATQQQQELAGERASQRTSSGAAGESGLGGLSSLIGYVRRCTWVDEGPSQQCLLEVQLEPDASGTPGWHINLTGRLADRAAQLCQHQLLQPGHKVLVVCVRPCQHDPQQLQQTSRSRLVVDPAAAAAAGLPDSQQLADTWVSKWQKRDQERQQQQQATSSGPTNRSVRPQHGHTLVGFVHRVTPAQSPVGSQQFTLDAASKPDVSWKWRVRLAGELADRAAHLLRVQLLQPGHQVIVTNLVRAASNDPGDGKMHFDHSPGACLLVDPDMTAAAGGSWRSLDACTWKTGWAQWQQREDARQRKQQQQQAGDAFTAQTTQPQPQQLATNRQQLQQQQGRQQQQQVVQGVGGQAGQARAAPVQLGLGGAAAAAVQPGLAAAGGTVQQEHGDEAADGGAEPLQDEVQDSQATIKYATLPSTW